MGKTIHKKEQHIQKQEGEERGTLNGPFISESKLLQNKSLAVNTRHSITVVIFTGY